MWLWRELVLILRWRRFIVVAIVVIRIVAAPIVAGVVVGPRRVPFLGAVAAGHGLEGHGRWAAALTWAGHRLCSTRVGKGKLLS